MKYKLIQRVNPQERETPAKYYASPIWDGVVDIDVLTEVIAGRSSLTAGDVSNVLHNFLDEIPRFMLMGKAVDLKRLGIFRISFSSDGVDTPEEFKPATMMRNPKIVFRASSELKKRVEDSLTFERITTSADE